MKVIKKIIINLHYLALTGILIIASCLLMSTPVAEAHSSIEKTIPNSGELLKTAPTIIELWFQDEVEVSSNSITLSNREGEEIPLWAPQIDAKNRRHISVVIEDELPPGYYTVDIRVLALDGDPLIESYQFAVEKPQIEAEEMWRLLKLEKSVPADGTIVKSSPEQIELWFTQPAELSAFGLFDDHQRVIPIVDPRVNPLNPKHYSIEMEEALSPGTYTINWYARIGGKERNGIIYFAVGEVTSIVSPNGVEKRQSLSKISMLDVSKWFVYLGLLILFGGTWFSHMIAKQRGNKARWRKISLFLYGVSISGLLLLLFQRRNESFQISYIEFMSLPFIWIPILQILLLSVGYWLTKGKLQLVLYALAVFLWTFIGHAVQPRYGGSIGIGIDALHLFGVSIWMGGLFALLIMTPKENPLSWLKEAGKAYSKWAFISIFIIIFTGIWMTVKYVPTFTLESLFISEWGKMIWIKVVLLVGIIILGFLQRNSLKRLSDKLVNLFIIRSRIELIIGLLILFAASILVNLSPTEAEQGIYPKVVVQDGIKGSIKIEPFKTGLNDITIHFEDHPTFEQVHVKLAMPPQWKIEHTAFDLGNGTYRLTGNFLHTAGAMYMEVEAKTPDGRKFVFPFRVQIPGKMPEWAK